MSENRPPSTGPRVVVVGVGRFGALHVRVWREAGADVVGICDTSPLRLDEIARRFGIDVAEDDAERLIRRLQPDAVVIATDEHTHAALAISSLAAGAHVFVEKPLALSGEEAWRIHAASRAAGREVVAGQISRFAAAYIRMRASIDSGRIGRLCALRLRRDFPYAWFVGFGARVHPVWESCIHDIDLAVGFVCRPVVRAFGLESGAAGDASSGVVASLLEFEGGVVATIESAWLLPDHAPQTMSGAMELAGSIVGEAEAIGRTGVVRQRLVSDALVEWTEDGVAVPDLSLWPEEDGRVQGALRREVSYALDVFGGLRPNDIIPLEQACWGVEAAEAIVGSIASGGPVAISRRAGLAGS